MESSSDILAFHLNAIRRKVLPLVRQTNGDAETVLQLIDSRNKERDTFSLLAAGLDFARDAHFLAQKGGVEECRSLAVTVADALCRRNAQPTGAFMEYDRNSWIEPAAMWRTTPWGTAFHGMRMFKLYHTLGAELPAESRDWWQATLEKTARWIYGNPLLGSFVFNCVIDLCALLWHIGREFGNDQWTAWALKAAHERIRRDIDAEGLIQGEGGGCSGAYQLVGTRLLAQFAWDSQDPVLLETIQRVTAAILGFATQTLFWPGNFGTRSSIIEKLVGELCDPDRLENCGVALLVTAAQGNEVAAHFVRKFREPHWSRDLALWDAALATPAKAPEVVAVHKLQGIESVKVREGSFVGYFCNYDRSIWARGFCNLWHAALDDMIFSTLHSLPSEVEKSKLHLGDTTDWAGFPHVRVAAGEQTYDSQRQIRNLTTAEGDGVRVAWSEPLSDAAGNEGGLMHSEYHFAGEWLQMKIGLENLAGSSRLDFHLMKRIGSFGGLWCGEAIESMEKGELPRVGGWFTDMTFGAGETGKFGVQIDNVVFVFETTSLPKEAIIQLGLLRDNGLHTCNHGGFRLRIELPESVTSAVLELGFYAVTLTGN